MTDVQNPDAQIDIQTRAPRADLLRRRLSLVVLFAGAACLVFAFAFGGRAAPASTTTNAAPLAPPAAPQDRDFSKFPHGTPTHASQACAACHQRNADNSTKPVLPGHKACTDCHLAQFVTPLIPMCAMCHTNLDSGNPPVKSFPGLRSFNAKFDHAQHMNGAARPANGCVSCHAPMRRGVALSIPAGLGAHANCYTCHTPQASANGRNIGSCAACHALSGYSRTPTNARAFRVSFSHRDHGGRQRLGCTDCHTVRGGLPQSRQVTATLPTQHFASGRGQSCMTCHNNQRAFGGNDFADCKRCHKGQTFNF